jgi:hypothetical protein
MDGMELRLGDAVRPAEIERDRAFGAGAVHRPGLRVLEDRIDFQLA